MPNSVIAGSHASLPPLPFRVRGDRRQRAQLSAPPLAEWLETVTPSYRWDWPHLVYIREHLERVASGACNRLMLFVPPRHGKSELATVRFPVWLLERDPAQRVIIGAYNQTLANMFARRARRIAAPRLTLSADRTAVDDWETTTGGGVRAVGVGGGITGRGGNIIIIDDPVKSREEAESAAYRNRVWEWYTDDLYTRLEPGGAIVLIMTRWHEDDLAGRILASEDGPNWTVVSLPAEAEVDDPLGRPHGAALCPERFDLGALADRRRVLGAYAYGALYQQRPAPVDGGMFRRSWWRRYDAPPGHWDRIIQSWDLSFTDTAGSDYVCGGVWAQVGPHYYLLDLVHERLDFPATLTAIEALSLRYPQTSARLIEDKANGPAVIAALRNRLPGIIAVNPRGGKVARAAAVAPLVEAGNVHLPSYSSAADALINECAAFPTAAHDDYVDMLSQALNWLTTRAGGWSEDAMKALSSGRRV